MENYLKIYALLLLTFSWRPWYTTAQITTDPANDQGDNFESPIARQIMRLAKSAEIRNFMKPEVNACDDFYTYSCGNWGQINPSNGKTPKTLYNTLMETYNRKVTKFLSDNKESSDTEFVRKVKYFYESCLQRDHITLIKRQRLHIIMEEFGGMPALKGADWHEESFDWLQVVAKILRKYGTRIIIGVEVEPDFNNTAINRLYIGQIQGMLPAEYEQFLTDFWKAELESLFGLPPSKSLITAREMAELATKLSLGVSDPLSGLGLQDKSKLMFLENMTDKYAPTLNLTSFVNTWLGYEYQLPVYEYVEDYIRNLRTTIAETPTTTLANYIMMMLIQDFDFEVREDKEEHKRKCVRATRKHFFKYIDHLMYKDLEKSHPKIIYDAMSMFQHLKQKFADILKSPSMMWMAESTRDKALEKLSAMTFQINGYANVNFTQELGSLTMSSGDYTENVVSLLMLRGQNLRMKVNKPSRFEYYEHVIFSPMYMLDFNIVTMPMYFLQPLHLWEDAYPKALHYGTIGYIIAHEMIHGFDDTSRKHDAKGNLNNWWDRNSSAIFETRKECLRQQYGTFKHGGRFLTKIQDQGENIADVGGLRVAYQAYDEWLTGHHQTPEHLPHMDTITARQLFFIAAAQVWCTETDSDWNELYTHTPEAARVQGALPLVTATTFCFSAKWKWLIIISYCLFSLWGLYKALTASSPWQRRLCFALPFTMRSILTFFRTLGVVGGNSVALPHVYLQDGVSIIGGAIGAMRIPEKWFPGLVDFYLNSHNIMHVLVVVAVYSMHKATIKDFEWMSTTNCEAFTNVTSKVLESTLNVNIEL